MRTLMGRELLLAAALGFGACGGDGDGSFSPTVANVAGSYSALVFTLTSGVGTTDLLALGSSVTVTLATDRTTTGRLFVPGGAEDGSDLDEDLAGTWTLTGSTVTFNQTADTFIRDVEFTVTQNQLTSEGVFQGSTIRLVLGKTG
jgi:hypothetical protein